MMDNRGGRRFLHNGFPKIMGDFCGNVDLQKRDFANQSGKVPFSLEHKLLVSGGELSYKVAIIDAGKNKVVILLGIFCDFLSSFFSRRLFCGFFSRLSRFVFYHRFHVALFGFDDVVTH